MHQHHFARKHEVPTTTEDLPLDIGGCGMEDLGLASTWLVTSTRRIIEALCTCPRSASSRNIGPCSVPHACLLSSSRTPGKLAAA